MFDQVIDFLFKKDDVRQWIFFLLLKLLFTLTLSVKIYGALFGSFAILNVMDYKGIIDFFINGRAVICFAIFFFTWLLSYNLIGFVLNLLVLLPVSGFNKFLGLLFENDAKLILRELYGDLSFRKQIEPVLNWFTKFEIIELRNESIRPGDNFYEFFDFLLLLEERKFKITFYQFTSSISLIIQFIIIYNWSSSDLHVNWFVTILVSVILLVILILVFTIYLILYIVDSKHSRIIDVMAQIDPDYLEYENIEEVQEPVGSKANPLVIELKKKKVRRK